MTVALLFGLVIWAWLAVALSSNPRLDYVATGVAFGALWLLGIVALVTTRGRVRS